MYDALQAHELVGFYYLIKKEIKRGVLSQAMYQEIKLIKQAAIRKGFFLDYSYKKGLLIVKVEQLIK